MAFDSLSERLNRALRTVAGKSKLSDANMEDMLREIRLALLEADVNYKIVRDFLEEIREKARGEDVLSAVDPGQQLVKIVHDEIVALLGRENVGINYKETGITVIMMVGLQGTGKTTSLAKIAKIVRDRQNRQVMAIAGDVIRPAAIEQLETLGEEIGMEVFTLGPDKSAAETIGRGMIYARQHDYDTVFIDTAGRLHVDEELMNELVTVNEHVHPDEILLTVDAMTGQDIVNVAKAFAEALPLTGLVVTKFDGDARGGGVLSVRKITGVPVKFVGEGEKIDDMDVFYPDRMADRILGMGDIVTLVEKAQQKMDMEESEALAKRMLEGRFTMDDMLAQFEQINRLGPISGIIKMLPGMGQFASAMDEMKADDIMKHSKAIIQSMTKWEKANPAKIRSTMKKRIAAGSGTTVNDVNRLINQFNKTKKAMDQIGMMSRSGRLNEETLARMMDSVEGQMPAGMRNFKK